MTTRKRQLKKKKIQTGKPQMLFLIGGGLLVFGVAAMWLLLMGNKPAASRSEFVIPPAEVNYAAPVLQLQDLDGDPAALADYHGQVVLVNNWATWCPPCKEEMPTLQAYFEAHQDDGFTIVAVESGNSPQEVARFVEQYQLTFVVLPDPQGRSLAAFRNNSLPSSYVIDREGNVRLVWRGMVSMAALEKYITPMLEE